MTSRKALSFLCAVLTGCLFLLGGCSPRDSSSQGNSSQDLMTVEGVLLKLGGYTGGENQWALCRAEESADPLLLFSLPEEAQVEGGALEEGQQVQVTCQSVREIAPPVLEGISQVEILESVSQEELETAQAKAAEYVENLAPPEEDS